jgi:hypothetical protein
MAKNRNEKEEDVLARAERVKNFVLGILQELGEHPECELKIEWPQNTPYHKAEFIKDVQSIANSEIPEGKEKYVIVGASEVEKKIVGCNVSEYEEAKIKQLLGSYLDPAPEIELLKYKTPEGADYVVFRFPHQSKRPFVVKKSILGEKQKEFLAEGSIWVKPGSDGTGSTGKRLVNSGWELREMIDVELRVNEEVEQRLQRLIPEIRIAEQSRIRGTTLNVNSIISSTDLEFSNYIAQLVASDLAPEFNVLLEKLRDAAIIGWTNLVETETAITEDIIRTLKQDSFLPAMNRITLLGLLLVKFSCPLSWFNYFVEMVLEIYDLSNKLSQGQNYLVPSRGYVKNIEEHNSSSVPALETLISSFVIAGYAVCNRKRIEYARAFFPRIVKSVAGRGEKSQKTFFLFWKISISGGYPDRQRQLLVLDRYGQCGEILKVLGGGYGLKSIICQFDIMIDFHSYIGIRETGIPATVDYYSRHYPGVGVEYPPNYIFESYDLVMSVIENIWELMTQNTGLDLFLDPRLGEIVRKQDPSVKKALMGRFLIYMKKTQSEAMFSQNRFPFSINWPLEINEYLCTLGG